MTREEAIKALNEYGTLFPSDKSEAIDIAIEALDISTNTPTKSTNTPTNTPTDASADRPSDEEDQLKFYYVESIDDYWIGMRIDNFYYADWHGRLGFVWSHSKHLPWGEHIVDENTLWKEHTYPSEPIEIPFTEWIVGFVKKYFAERPKGEWIHTPNGIDQDFVWWTCSECGHKIFSETEKDRIEFHAYCGRCGAYMRGDTERC